MSIQLIIDDIIKAEGGYSNNVDDTGGETMYGITINVAKANGYYGPMKDLPLSIARQIYLNQYWLAPKFDQIERLSPLVAEELCDMGVNMGTSFAREALQQALNLLNRNEKDYRDIKEDGSIGQGTLAALAAFLVKRKESLLLKTLIIMRGARYLAICKNNPVQEAFLAGWLENRVHFSVGTK